MKLAPLQRIFLLLAVLLASYQIAIGIDGFSALPIAAYTIAFGALLVAALLIFVLGLDALDYPIAVIISTIIPLSLAVGLVWQHLAAFQTVYLIFAIVGFLAVTFSRLPRVQNQFSIIALILTHGIAGLTIFLLPIFLVLQARAEFPFALVGLGGGLVGALGLLLSLQKMGRALLPRETILKFFPATLFIVAALFVVGFKFSG